MLHRGPGGSPVLSLTDLHCHAYGSERIKRRIGYTVESGGKRTIYHR